MVVKVSVKAENKCSRIYDKADFYQNIKNKIKAN